MQHARARYLSYTSAIYLVYLFFNDITLHDSTTFPTNWSIGIAATGEGHRADKATKAGSHEQGLIDVEFVQG